MASAPITAPNVLLRMDRCYTINRNSVRTTREGGLAGQRDVHRAPPPLPNHLVRQRPVDRRIKARASGGLAKTIHRVAEASIGIRMCLNPDAAIDRRDDDRLIDQH